MSGVYGYPQPRSPVAVPRVVAAGLLVLSGVLAVGGSFGAFSVYRFESRSEYVESSTTTTTGWGDIQEPPPEAGEPAAAAILHGIPLVVAALLAVVAAVLLVLSARRPGDPAPGRLLGTGAAGLLVGVIAVIWLELITFTGNVASNAANAAPDSEFRSTFEIGVGGYLVLVSGLAALAAAVLLLVPRRGPAPWPVPPFGPGQQPWPQPQQQWMPPQQWAGPPQQWAQPGYPPPPGPGAPPPQ
jgi:hypothetical protein